MNEKQADRDFRRNHQIGGRTDGITPEAAAEQGLISYAEAEDFSGEHEKKEWPEIVSPSEKTIAHWSENTEQIAINHETRLYAVGEDGEHFAWVERASENIAVDMERLLEKATNILTESRQQQIQKTQDDSEKLDEAA